MTQLELFAAPCKTRKPPIARSTDPQTSHDAAATVQLNDKQWSCMQVLTGEMTANEIGQAAATRFNGMAETYRKRVHELQRKQLIVACGERVCNVTGSNATIFKRRT